MFRSLTKVNENITTTVDKFEGEIKTIREKMTHVSKMIIMTIGMIMILMIEIPLLLAYARTKLLASVVIAIALILKLTWLHIYYKKFNDD